VPRNFNVRPNFVPKGSAQRLLLRNKAYGADCPYKVLKYLNQSSLSSWCYKSKLYLGADLPTNSSCPYQARIGSLPGPHQNSDRGTLLHKELSLYDTSSPGGLQAIQFHHAAIGVHKSSKTWNHLKQELNMDSSAYCKLLTTSKLTYGNPFEGCVLFVNSFEC
jgi:hypothetical protein